MKDLMERFAKSPVPAVQEHVDHCAACVEALIGAVDAGSPGARVAAEQEIDERLAQAEALRQVLRQLVTRRLFLPVSRAAMRELVERQHAVGTAARSAARHHSLLSEAGIDALATHAETVLQANMSVVVQLVTSIHELDELFEVGFRGAEVELVGRMIDELDRLEEHAENALWEARRALLQSGSGLNGIQAALALEGLDRIAEVGRRADSAGRQLETLINS